MNQLPREVEVDLASTPCLEAEVMDQELGLVEEGDLEEVVEEVMEEAEVEGLVEEEGDLEEVIEVGGVVVVVIEVDGAMEDGDLEEEVIVEDFNLISDQFIYYLQFMHILHSVAVLFKMLPRVCEINNQ